jgi:hypothetical protein
MLGDPERLLNELFQRRVRVKQSGTKATQPRKVAARIFQNAFHPYGLESWIEEDTEVAVRHHCYHFDIGIKNGNLRYAIQTLSFRKADLQRVEEAGGYYAHIWPMIYKETGAKGLWLVEAPTTTLDITREQYQLVTGWASNAGIEVYDFNKTKEVAEQIASELNRGASSHDSLRE